MADLLDIPTSFLFSRLFAIRPVIRKENGTLVAVSNWRTVLLTLGALQRKVVVDPRQRTIRLRMRRFWFVVKTRRIEFDWVQSVVYGHAEMSTGSVLPMNAYQEQDLFAVGLSLKNGEELILFRFYGEGSFVNNSVFPDWMLWEGFLEAKLTAVDQESASSAFADVLAGLIGVPVVSQQP